MTRIKFQFVTLTLVLLLTACGVQATAVPTDAPTSTPLPTATITFTLTAPPSPTSTLTPIPSDTPIPLPASLIGTISISNGSVKPFSSTVELRMAESFDLVAGEKTNSKGEYKIEDFQPGKYELWVLITAKSAMLSGCNDVRPQDEAWKIGVNFEDGKGLTMENAYLSKALFLVDGLKAAGLKAKGYYACFQISKFYRVLKTNSMLLCTVISEIRINDS